MKQLATALHNFHDTYKRLPPGCAQDQRPFGTNVGGWGSSWKVYILPYVEQGVIFDNWVLDGTNSGYTNANNMALVHRVTIPAYRCPSTVLPEFYPGGGWNGGATNEMYSCYTGIAGAGSNTAPFTANTTGGHGWTSGDGCLNANSKVNFASLTDGTSNVILVGEQSNHLRDANGMIVAGGFGAITSQGPHGWTMGAGNQNVGNAYTDRHFNCTTVRWTINQIGFTSNAATGTNDNTGNNTPLSSLHPGGCHVALGDASNRFVSQDVPLATLLQLSCISDGVPVQMP